MRDTPNSTEAPDYRVYRARRRLLPGRGDGGWSLGDLRRRDGRGPGRRTRKRVTVGRVVRWLAAAVALWLLVSLGAFLVSGLGAAHVDSEAQAQLDPGSSGLLSSTTTLILGSDARPKGSKEPGANASGSRSDTIMLMRSGGGTSAKLSIPRDTIVDIPGHGRTKINAAYAYGGAGLAIKTIKQYLGIPINHVIEINFQNFPTLIDSMGGIDYTGSCVVSVINGGYRNGGITLHLTAGTHHIDGKRALALARTRKNACNHAEDDRARVRRQQKILAGMKNRVVSPAGFIRLPWISWQTPRAIRTDMGGPSLLAFTGGVAASGTAPTRVLPGTPTPTGSLIVTDARKRAAVQQFLNGG
ncbi:MAG: LytR family transcriptional regulator [Solirubrobacterales bacterium]|nr:LytR family transcriptional regulator [Solirubrobacterales bacterium]